MGDCATIEGLDLPATAQVANQKAIYLSSGKLVLDLCAENELSQELTLCFNTSPEQTSQERIRVPWEAIHFQKQRIHGLHWVVRGSCRYVNSTPKG